MSAADLRTFRRSFVRAEWGPECLLEGETTQADLDEDRDTFWCGIANAEMAAHHDLIDCAACGSKDVCRAGFGHPDKFGTLTTPTGALYGYALCRNCLAERAKDPARIEALVDAVFDAAMGRKRKP